MAGRTIPKYSGRTIPKESEQEKASDVEAGPLILEQSQDVYEVASVEAFDMGIFE